MSYGTYTREERRSQAHLRGFTAMGTLASDMLPLMPESKRDSFSARYHDAFTRWNADLRNIGEDDASPADWLVFKNVLALTAFGATCFGVGVWLF